MSWNLFARPRPTPHNAWSCDCEGVRLRLVSYIDGELGPYDRSLVDAHLTQCADCRSELNGFRRAESALGVAVRSIASPGDLRADFYARLERTRKTPAIGTWRLAIPALAVATLMLFTIRSAIQSHSANRVAEALPATPRLAERENQLRRIRSADIAMVLRTVHGDTTISREIQSTVEPRSPFRRRGLTMRTYRQVASGRRNPRRSLTSFVARLSRGAWKHGLRVRGDSDAVSLDAHPQGLTTATSSAYDGPSDRLALLSYGTHSQRYKTVDETPGGSVNLANLTETELHVSDEERDFMSSTHVDSTASRKDSRTGRVDDNNGAPQESVELPALP